MCDCTLNQTHSGSQSSVINELRSWRAKQTDLVLFLPEVILSPMKSYRSEDLLMTNAAPAWKSGAGWMWWQDDHLCVSCWAKDFPALLNLLLISGRSLWEWEWIPASTVLCQGLALIHATSTPHPGDPDKQESPKTADKVMSYITSKVMLQRPAEFYCP